MMVILGNYIPVVPNQVYSSQIINSVRRPESPVLFSAEPLGPTFAKVVHRREGRGHKVREEKKQRRQALGIIVAVSGAMFHPQYGIYCRHHLNERNYETQRQITTLFRLPLHQGAEPQTRG